MAKQDDVGIDISLEKDSKIVTKSPSGPPSDDGLDNPTGIKEKALLWKLDRKLLPAVTILYLLSFLDRSNGMWIVRPSRRKY